MLIALLLGACTAAEPLPVEPSPAPSGAKRIALTYDDAPRGDGPAYTGRERTERLLAELARAEAEAAIFVTTRGMDTDEGRARIASYAEDGHPIANHSDTHPWASRTDVDAYLADIDAAEAKLEGLPNRRPWFRFPFLDEGGYGEDTAAARARRDALRDALAERGLRSGYVTVDTYDWHLDRLWKAAVEARQPVDMDALEAVYVAMVVDAAEHYDAMATDVLGRRPAHVLLLHENDLAAEFTDEAVAALRERGWRIVTPDEAFADPIAETLPDTLFGGMGRIAALAHDAGRRGADVFDHWSADEAGIEARVAEAGVFGE